MFHSCLADGSVNAYWVTSVGSVFKSSIAVLIFCLVSHEVVNRGVLIHVGIIVDCLSLQFYQFRLHVF